MTLEEMAEKLKQSGTSQIFYTGVICKELREAILMALKDRDTWRTKAEGLAQERDALRERVEQLKKFTIHAHKDYTDHDGSCKIWLDLDGELLESSTGKCTCGLTALLTEAEGKTA